jgi:N6-adenosine-specific RNA methylase IME4
VSDWFFDPLTPMSYDVIVIDPPWYFMNWSEKGEWKSASKHYQTMAHDRINAMPVDQLAQRDCVLLLWSTGAMMPQALAAMSAWGFTYKTQMIWRKVTKNGKVRMGTGYWARTMHEPILIGTIGKPTKVRAFPSLFDGIAREHSRKPEEFYEIVNRCTPSLRRADVFSRQPRLGWNGFGDEQEKWSA